LFVCLFLFLDRDYGRGQTQDLMGKVVVLPATREEHVQGKWMSGNKRNERRETTATFHIH
jgi:hypothetical protein